MISPADKPALGFIGLGIMGAPMVRRLRAEGYAVTAWNREPERAAEVLAYGAKWADSPAAVRGAADIVMTCVLDDKAVEACCFGPGGLASAGCGANLLVDFSTIGPDATMRIARRLQTEAGIAWLDAPISGGPGPAESGTLAIMTGGAEADFARAAPVLQSLAANLTHMGPLGAGQITKLLNQAIVGVNYVLMAELLALAEATPLDASALSHALAGGLADSTILQRIYPQMQARDFVPPRGRAPQLDKDLQAVTALIEATGRVAPLIARATALYDAFARSATSDTDSAAISQWVAARQHA